MQLITRVVPVYGEDCGGLIYAGVDITPEFIDRLSRIRNGIMAFRENYEPLGYVSVPDSSITFYSDWPDLEETFEDGDEGPSFLDTLEDMTPVLTLRTEKPPAICVVDVVNPRLVMYGPDEPLNLHILWEGHDGDDYSCQGETCPVSLEEIMKFYREHSGAPVQRMFWEAK